MKNEPVHVIRLGLIKCQIFLRKTSSGDRYNVTVCRIFKNGEQWQESKMFGRDDLLLVAKTLDLAHTWIIVKGTSAGGGHGQQNYGSVQ
ncbi:MAG: hypothetical protein AB7U20_03865 [Planctomycetaceae bacterium]